MPHKDRSRILVIIGMLVLLVGLANAVLGPVEIYCFYLFSRGGPFHYEGFGFGSFMFGYIAAQIVGYYLLAALLIPLGYGHLRLRRWARTLSLTLLYAWLVLGVPFLFVFLFVLLTAKDLAPATALVALFLVGLSYLVVPAWLIRFYQGQNVRLTLESRDPDPSWLERRPLPILVLCVLFLFYIIVWHILILFRGIFPLYGSWLVNLEGIVAITVAILSLLWLTWGLFRLRTWAWWGSLVYLSWMATAWLLTLSMSSYAHILSLLDFPPTEMQALRGLPFQGVHFALLVGIPLILTLGVLVRSKRHFDQARPSLL